MYKQIDRLQLWRSRRECDYVAEEGGGEEIGSQSGLEPRLGTPEARDACEICMGTATVAVAGWLVGLSAVPALDSSFVGVPNFVLFY